MRRILPILILLVLGLGPAGGSASIFAASLQSGVASGWTGKVEESRLPACCRRAGAHHCSMHLSLAATPGQTTVDAPSDCPCTPSAVDSSLSQIAAVLTTASIACEFPTSTAASPHPSAASSQSQHPGCPKRGPPSDQANPTA